MLGISLLQSVELQAFSAFYLAGKPDPDPSTVSLRTKQPPSSQLSKSKPLERNDFARPSQNPDLRMMTLKVVLEKTLNSSGSKETSCELENVTLKSYEDGIMGITLA